MWISVRLGWLAGRLGVGCRTNRLGLDKVLSRPQSGSCGGGYNGVRKDVVGGRLRLGAITAKAMWRKCVCVGGCGVVMVCSLVTCAKAGVSPHHITASCLRESGFFMDPDEDDLVEAHPIEMNEVTALTHTSLLKQASGVAVDSAIQLLHRTLRATLDFSQQHRKQLQEVIDLLEYCTTMLRHTQEHDRLWDMLVEARAKADNLKQQLRDLNLLLTYATATVENTAMAAYISGYEFSASAARQITDSAKLELTTDEKKTEALEMQYIRTHTRYIEAAQRMMDEANTGDKGESEETMGETGSRERKEDDADDAPL